MSEASKTTIVDTLTAGVKRAADILFAANPTGTSIGVFAGVAADGLLELFNPFFKRFVDVVDVARLNVFYCIAFGVLIFNIPVLFRRRQLPKEIEDAFAAIERSRDELPPLQRKLQYLALCSSVVNRAAVETSGIGPPSPS